MLHLVSCSSGRPPHPLPHPSLAFALPSPPASRAPAGPWSPGSMLIPSPEVAQQVVQGLVHDYTRINVTPASLHPRADDSSSSEEAKTPIQPPAKALGERPARVPHERTPGGFDPDDISFERSDSVVAHARCRLRARMSSRWCCWTSRNRGACGMLMMRLRR